MEMGALNHCGLVQGSGGRDGGKRGQIGERFKRQSYKSLITDRT